MGKEFTLLFGDLNEFKYVNQQKFLVHNKTSMCLIIIIIITYCGLPFF